MHFLRGEALRVRLCRRLGVAAGLGAACATLTLWLVLHAPRSWRSPTPDVTLMLPLFMAACGGAITIVRAHRARSEESCIALGSLFGIATFATFEASRLFTPRWRPPNATEALGATLLCVVLGSVLGLVYGVFLLVTLLNPSLPMRDVPAHDAPARASLIAARHLFLAGLLMLGFRGLYAFNTAAFAASALDGCTRLRGSWLA